MHSEAALHHACLLLVTCTQTHNSYLNEVLVNEVLLLLGVQMLHILLFIVVRQCCWWFMYVSMAYVLFHMRHLSVQV